METVLIKFEKEVTKCSECPFYSYTNDGHEHWHYCGMSENLNEFYDEAPKTKIKKNCPFKKKEREEN